MALRGHDASSLGTKDEIAAAIARCAGCLADSAVTRRESIDNGLGRGQSGSITVADCKIFLGS